MIRPLALMALAALAACNTPRPVGMVDAYPAPVEVVGNLTIRGEPAGYARALPSAAPGATFAPPDAEAHAFARRYLGSIQAASIADRVEYCGYFYVDGSGRIAATPPRRGTFASCDMPSPRPGMGVFASYHTHGAFGRSYDNEVPSVTDLLSDFQFGVDGYVSTPGGRVWHVDNGTRTTRQICGLRCVYADPGFVPMGESLIRASYDLEQLNRRASGAF